MKGKDKHSQNKIKRPVKYGLRKTGLPEKKGSPPYKKTKIWKKSQKPLFFFFWGRFWLI